MKVLAWLAFPLLATVVAMAWAAWRGRGRSRVSRRSGTFAAVEEFRHFTDVLRSPGPSAVPEPRGGVRGAVQRLSRTRIAGQGS